MNNDEINIRTIIGPIQRQLKLVITIILITIIAASLFGFSITPKYSATSLLFIDPGQKDILASNVERTNYQADNALVDSEVEIMKSANILRDLTQRLDLISDSEFGVSISLKDKVLSFLKINTGTENDAAQIDVASQVNSTINKLRNSISVSRRGLTYLISITATSEDPEKAAAIANEFSDAYIRDQIASKVRNIQLSLNTIQNQIADTEQDVIRTQRSLDSFVTDNLDNIIDATGSPEIAELKVELSELNKNVIRTRELSENLDANIEAKNWVILADSLQSDAMRTLEEQRREISEQISASVEDSEIAINLERELDQIEQRLENEARELTADLSSKFSNAQTAADELQEKINSTVLQADLPADINAQIFRLSQESRNVTTQYQTLITRAQELNAQTVLQIADSRVVSRALAPNSPSSPNLKLIIFIAIIIGVSLGVGVAFLLENFIGGFTSAEQLEAVTGYPLISTIMKQPPSSSNQAGVSNELINKPLSRFAESIRRIRSAADLAMKRAKFKGTNKDEKKGTVIMVSSSVPAEGKTTVALSLARTYAISGKKTIVIDCDLRKPSLHKHLQMDTKEGLGDLLTSKIDPEIFANIVVKDPETSLTAILGSRKANLPVDELIAKQPFDKVLNIVSSRFDYIILDTPPIDPVVDGLYLAEHADVVTFVVKWAKTSQRQVSDSLRALSASVPEHNEIIMVMNQQEGATDHYDSSYSDYYSD